MIDIWHDVQNKETVICAKFGKDLLNISKLMGRKTKWSRFFRLPGTLHTYKVVFVPSVLAM